MSRIFSSPPAPEAPPASPAPEAPPASPAPEAPPAPPALFPLCPQLCHNRVLNLHRKAKVLI